MWEIIWYLKRQDLLIFIRLWLIGLIGTLNNSATCLSWCYLVSGGIYKTSDRENHGVKFLKIQETLILKRRRIYVLWYKSLIIVVLLWCHSSVSWVWYEFEAVRVVELEHSSGPFLSLWIQLLSVCVTMYQKWQG